MDLIPFISGSFCPPTFGHLDFLRKATKKHGQIIIICSQNPSKKNNWFTPEQCVKLWNSYDIPKGTRAYTLKEFLALDCDRSRLLMMMGCRNEQDRKDFEANRELNEKEYGLSHFELMLSNPDMKNISSSRARKSAQNLNFMDLAEVVSPLAITALLEKVLKINHLIIVTGRAGSGKSYFCKTLHEIDPQNIHLNSDTINHALRGLLEEKFANENLIEMANKEPQRIMQAIGKEWFSMLAEMLWEVPDGSNVFLEIPYALRKEYSLFKNLGAKILYVHTQKSEELVQRNKHRGTEKLLPILNSIPGKDETIRTCIKDGLMLQDVDLTADDITTIIRPKAKEFYELLEDHEIFSQF